MSEERATDGAEEVTAEGAEGAVVEGHVVEGPGAGEPVVEACAAGEPVAWGSAAGEAVAEGCVAREPGVEGRRKAARVVLLDGRDRVLLMHGFDPEDPSLTWWFTPGGGLEGDEAWERAARRELAEETGITDIELGPVLWQRHCSFFFDGRVWDQEEWYYLARTDQEAAWTGGATDLERRSVTGLRWWTCEELLMTRETVYPTKLAELVHALLDEGPPSTPVLLETERA